MAPRSEIGPAPLPDDGNPWAAAGEMRRMGMAMWSSAIIQSAAELRLADTIGDEPVNVSDLAEAAGAHEPTLRRLLQALTAHGIFRFTDDGRVAHTTASRSLAADFPGSVRDLNLLGAAEWNWAIWSRLTDAVRTGAGVFPKQYGKDLYRYFAEDNPDAGAVFDRAMAESSRWTGAPVAETLDLAGAATLADVGGGQGSLLALLLTRNPHLSGVLIDRAQVVAHADPALTESELASRCTRTAADIRAEVPVAADVYLLRQVTHIWDDDTAVAILRNCADHAQPGARLVLVEHVIEEGNANSTYTTLMDLQMMLLGLGRERTERQYAELLDRAGWRLARRVSTASPLDLLEATLSD